MPRSFETLAAAVTELWGKNRCYPKHEIQRWGKSTSSRSRNMPVGRLTELDEVKPTQQTACRYVDRLGRYWASKFFVGQAPQTGNGNLLRS
jgi:hypothetical protein